MSNVYLKEISNETSVEDIKSISRLIFETLLEKEKISLNKIVPLKVHFGEMGNVTYIKPENYDGIIDSLDNKGIETCFMESSVMYGGQRHNKELHLKTAEAHGFTRKPVIIADGDHGESFTEVEINKNHFKTCKLGKEFLKYDQFIVLSHFKGHMLAGFGGAIKQLSMGFASKGGKLAMHMGIKPHIINRKCKKCHRCEPRCNENAITIGDKSSIDHSKCVGCGACVSICPYQAISIISFKSVLRMIGIGNPFREKVVEYALAAHHGRRNIYINFIMNVTAGCDCEPKKMKPLVPDLAILASLDPLAIDTACLDLVEKAGKKFKGREQLHYAEKIGLGSTHYTLVTV